MSTHRLRIHIAGSASLNARADLLAASHKFVGQLAHRLIADGAGLVSGFGDEPLGDAGIACTFDWTVLEVISEETDPAPNWSPNKAGRFRLVGSQRALEKIPGARQAVWERCTTRADVDLHLSPPGWRMGGLIRASQVQIGDVLVVIGGGAGVEQLAEMYLDDGKSVLPVRTDLGSLFDDGNGGGSYLQGRALSDTRAFFKLRQGTGSAAARLTEIAVDPAENPADRVSRLASLIDDLRPPRAFYVRLLDTESDAFEPVERFFREVVDPVVTEGYTPHEVGSDDPLAPFLNVEIFEGIHRAALVVVDLTDVRPNCMMELGYALARHRRVIITAMQGTQLPFDSDKLPTHFWADGGTTEDRRDKLRGWIGRYIDLPPLVE